MRKVNYKYAVGALLLSALAGTFGWGAAVAADVEQIPPPPPLPLINPANPGVPQPGAEKTSILDDNYVFDDNGRRDPFTFTKAVVNLEPPGPDHVPGPEEPTGLSKELVEKKRSASELALNMAEQSLMELDPNTSISKCEQGMEEFKDVPDISRYPELEVVKGRILRARKAGEQMRSRQAAERDFFAMNIKINGVMVHKKNPLAIINTKIVHKGDLVPVSGDATDIMVDEILSERVVFLFRGYRMTLLVAEAGGK